MLSKFRRLAESHRVDDVIAVATSAVREAENGGEFLKSVTSQTGIRPRVISGTEEARLIHSAAVYGISVPRDVAVVIDIGGGSVEVTRGAGAAIELGRSFKLGVIRLTERFVKTDPLEPRDERKLTRFIHTEIGKYLQQINRAGFDRVIGTSGTILSLGAVAAAADGRAPGTPLRNRRVAAKQIRRIRKDLVSLHLDKRLRVPGLEPRRADLAVAGAILLDELLRGLGAEEITLCDLSLREGLVLDFIARHRKEIASADRYPDVRRRSVYELGERCNYWPEHAQQVARLSVALFDQTRPIHGLTDREREWLEYAALLHDIGVHISYERHHKHSYYLIKNGGLRGFEPREIETMALVAPSSPGTPGRKRAAAAICRRSRRVVHALSALLRLAEPRRSHAQTSPAAARSRGATICCRCGPQATRGWAVGRTRHAAPFERLTGKPLRIEVSGTVYAEHAASIARCRETVRHRGIGIKRDARWAAGEVVEGRRFRVFVTHELVNTGEAATKTGKKQKALPGDVQLRHRDAAGRYQVTAFLGPSKRSSQRSRADSDEQDGSCAGRDWCS